MNPVLRASAAHVFVPSLADLALADDDAHHLFRVLRLRDGEAVTVADGRGAWQACRVAAGGLVADAEVVREPEPRPAVIASAIPKGDRLEWMVQKLTEIGATRIVLMDTARSVVRWTGERAERQVGRLQRVVREAASQSRRTWLPALDGPVPFAAAAALPGAVLAEPGGDTSLVGAGAVLVGPEGGFSEAELAVALPRVALSEHVLRVETAALVAVSRILT